MFVCRGFFFSFLTAPITQPQNGMEAVSIFKGDPTTLQFMYNPAAAMLSSGIGASSALQAPTVVIGPNQPTLQNGGEPSHHALSPANRNKRIKINSMPSEDVDGVVGEEREGSNTNAGAGNVYYRTRSPNLSGSSGWHGDQHPGTSIDPGES